MEEDEKYFRELLQRLEHEEKQSRSKSVLSTIVLTIGFLAFGTFLYRDATRIKQLEWFHYNQYVQARTYRIQDSIDFYLSKMPESVEKRRVHQLVNELDSIMVISIQKFSGQVPFEKGE